MGLKAKDVYGVLSEQIESVDRKLDDAIVGIYAPGGSVAFDNLPALSADVLGKVYTVTDDFTTTSDFVEGAGIDYPAGTNVAIVNRGTNASPVYKYDATTGAIVVDDSLSNVSENPVQNKIITAKTQAIELAISQLSASVLSKAPQTEVNEIKLDISNLSASVSSKASQAEVNEIKIDISNLSASVLHTSGNETATGVKTFSSGINSSKGVIGPKASGESDPHVPLELRGSDTEAWALFSNRLGVGLGYFGTTNDNKPYFYNTQAQRLVMASEVGTASAKNSTNAVTQNSTDLVESGAVYTAINTAIGNAVDNLLETSF